ncbi:MAG: FIVAR domain-containing protein, partial [Clostridia bacterium]|nr:FIVAR domain-containing protein [Clostridia bacterium]
LLTAGTSGYSTSVSSLRSISPSVGNNEDIYVYGPAPTAGGQIIEIPMTLWTYISQGGQYIYAGYKVVLRLVGYDMAALSALVAKETENNRPAAAYTSASFAAYASALSAARDMLAETKPQQTGIDAAFSALQSAISGLVSSGEADPADLYAAIDEARALDANAYTDFSGVRTAVNAALAELAAFENTTQERLDNRAAAIRLAVAKLTVKPAAAANRSVKVEGNHHWSGVAYGGFRLSAFGADETTADYNFSTDTQYMTREMNADDAPVATYYYDVNLIRTFADLASQKGFRLNYAVTNTSYADIMNYYISTGNSSYSSSAPNQIYVGSGYSANQTVNGTLPSVGGQELVLTLTAWTDIAQQATINNNTRYIHAGAKLKLRLVPFDKSVLQTAIGAKVYPQSFYTAESWQNYLSALSAAAAVNGKTVLLQSEIDEAAAALNGAIDALEFVSALDLTDLEAAIAEALALNAGDYVDFSGVTAAVDAAQDALYGAGDRTQEDIGNLAGAIRLAIRKLVAKPVSSPKSVSVTGTQDWTNVAAGTCRLTAFGADETTDSYNYGNGNWVQTREMSADLAPVATYYYDVNTIRTFADLAAAKGFRLNYTVVDRTYADIWNYWIGTDNSNYTTTAPGQIVLNGQPNGYNENRTVNGTLPSVGGQELTILLSCWTDMAQSGTITSSTYIHCGIKLKLRLVPFDKTALYAAMDTAIEPESHYTPESYAAYLSAIDAAAAVCAKAVVTQAEIDAAKNALLSAIDALTLKSFTVTFLRWDGATVDTQTVSYGQDAAAPATAATTYDGDNHYTFSAWSGDWTNVNSDRTVTALCDTAAHYGGTAKCNEYAKCDLCGAEYGDYADHEYGAWIPQVDKTCLEDGTLGHYTCSVCGKYFDADHNELTSLTIAHEGHKPVKTEEKASTCTEKGNIEYYTCDDCGKIFTEEACEHEITAEQTVLDYDYTNHSTDERVTKNAKDAKCNEDGYTGDIYCAACDHEVTHGSVIPKESIAHTPVKTEEKAATCTEKGNIEYYTCEVCGRIFTEETCENEIAADDTVLDFDYTNHSTDERVTKNAKDAKCNEDGYTGDIYCAACDHEVTHGSVIPKESIAHTPVKTEEKAASCTEKGNIEYYTCEVCGRIFTEETCENEIAADD